MNKVMILGAGYLQAPLIDAAHAIGCSTVVISPYGDYPGIEKADKYYEVDVADQESVYEIARKEEIEGIVSSALEVALPTIGFVSEKLHLPGYSIESSKKMRDKYLMKEAFARYDVSTAAFKKVKFDSDLKKECQELTFPAMVKIVDGSGSNGMAMARTLSEVSTKILNIKQYTKKDYCVVEEFISGEEFGAQGFVYKGSLVFLMLHGDYLYLPNSNYASGAIGHWAPFEISSKVQNAIFKETQKAINAIGLETCAINVDYILKDGIPYLLEICGRIGGNTAPEVVSACCSFNYYEKVVEGCLGLKPSFDSASNHYAVGKILKSNKTGRVSSISLSAIEEIENVFDCRIEIKKNSQVKKFKVPRDRIGQIVTTGNSLKEAERTMSKALALLANNIVVEE